MENNISNNSMFICDPPSGWRYGFPKVIPSEKLNSEDSFRDWLIGEGYPEKDVDFAMKHSSFMMSEEKEELITNLKGN